MVNKQNLIPLTKRSEEDAKKIRSNGGKRRAEVIKKARTLREIAEVFLSRPSDEKTAEVFKTMFGLKDANLKDELLFKQIEKARKGDLPSFREVKEILGEVEKQESIIPISIIIREDYGDKK